MTESGKAPYPPFDILDRISAYDASDGGHSDAAGASAYELLDDASSEIKLLRERADQAAKAAEGETADPRTTLHTVISDIREASGLGGRPMLGELAGEIGKLRERAERAEAALAVTAD